MPHPIIIDVCTVSLGLVTLIPAWFGHRMLVQPSASLPRGIYWQRPVQQLAVGLLVSADLTPETRAFAAARGYLGAGLPVLKPVAALPGETVCWEDDVLTIDGHVAGPIAPTDRLGRPLPRPYGCVVLRDAVLLLSTYSSFSWDGRYFGLTPLQAIGGEATLLWSWEASRPWPHARGRKDEDRVVVATAHMAESRAPGAEEAWAPGRITYRGPRPARHAMPRLAPWAGARE